MSESDTKPQGESRVYELSFLINPTISEDELPKHVGEIKEVVEQHATEFISEEYPKLTELAYTIQQMADRARTNIDRAYFGWMKFALSPESVAVLEEQVKGRSDIVRHLLIRTVRENTVATKRSYKDETLKRKEAQEEQAATGEINEAEVDQKIDALVEEEE